MLIFDLVMVGCQEDNRAKPFIIFAKQQLSASSFTQADMADIADMAGIWDMKDIAYMALYYRTHK